jgi:hypothetical protein
LTSCAPRAPANLDPRGASSSAERAMT